MGKSSKQKFVFDTSALISLGSLSIIEYTLSIAEIVVTPSVIKELEDFAKFDDRYGKAAKEVLKHKEKFHVEIGSSAEEIKFIEKTDNDLYAVAKENSLTLITDDIKFARHVEGKIKTEFSTVMMAALVSAGLLEKQKALKMLEELRDMRNWKSNIIYLASKEALEKSEE